MLPRRKARGRGRPVGPAGPWLRDAPREEQTRSPPIQDRPPSRRRPAGRAAAAALLTLLAGVASAQTAGQITPQTLAPGPPRLQGSVVFSGEPGLEAPAGAEALSVTIADVAVEGGLPALAGTERALEASLVGRPVPVSAIFEAARQLEAAYAREGFVLARVVLPAQTLRDGGRLRLVVVDGFVERIEARGLPAALRPRVERLAAPLVGRRGLTLGEIERPLLLAGDAPGVALRSALTAGARPGGTVLAFDADYRPVTGFVSVDNTLSDALGDWAVSTGLELNGALGRGELVYLRASAHPDLGGDGGLLDDDPRLRSLAAGVVLPVGLDGLTLNLEGVRSETTPELPLGVRTASEFERLSLRLRYPVRRSRVLDVAGEVILDAQSETLDVLEPVGDAALGSEDELRILRVAGDLRRQVDPASAVFLRAVASVGLDALGARSLGDVGDGPGLSRTGADADFRKLEVVGTYSHSVSERLAFTLYGRGQTSFGDPLPRSEQVGFASFRELSSFDSGTLGGDSGWLLRGDVAAPLALPSGRLPFGLATPYAFAAAGALRLEAPEAGEVETLRLGSIGVGLTLTEVIDPAFSSASVTLELGRAFRDDDGADENRLTVLASYRF